MCNMYKCMENDERFFPLSKTFSEQQKNNFTLVLKNSFCDSVNYIIELRNI